MSLLKKTILFGLMFWLMAMPQVANSQEKKLSKKQLESQQAKIEKNISLTKKLLNETSSKKKTSINQISLLKRQVDERKQLIKVYSSEISLLERQILTRQENINRLSAELKILKQEYAKLIYQSYKSRNHYDQWMFLLASDDFYQAMRRMKYLQEYNAYRRAKADDIVNTQSSIQNELNQLKKQKAERLGLLVTKEKETKSLEIDQEKKKIALSQLQQQEKDLHAQLAQQQKEWNKLNKEIQRLIEEEIERQKKASAKPGEKPTAKKTSYPLSPAETKLSNDFAANIGKLPWPIVRGTIVSHFGIRNHAELKITVDNKGTDFRVEKGALARSVFEGKVVKVIQLPRYKAVLIKHGDFYTVYDRLAQVYVKENDVVTTKQNIGLVWTDADNGETVLHFELRKQVVPQNPENWILRQ